MLDVLMYLFESYIDSGAEFIPDHESLETHLQDAGFTSVEITRILHWLEGLALVQASNQQHRPQGGYPIRLYAIPESKKINTEGRGFLMSLEQAGVLSPLTREKVISRAMSLEGEELTLDQLKWIVVYVLFHKSTRAAVFDKHLQFAACQGDPIGLH